MQGDPTPILISNAYAFGARNYDPKPIFKIMRKGAEEPEQCRRMWRLDRD